jgi:penicillin amidase
LIQLSSSNTVYKSAHPLAGERHRVTYGANARFVSDLSDPDENYFALAGGQDGIGTTCGPMRPVVE